MSNRIQRKISTKNDKIGSKQELNAILPAYTRKIIKSGLILARTSSNQLPANFYRKIHLWIDDISRFITITSTYSHLNPTKQLSAKVKNTNLKLVHCLEEISYLLKAKNFELLLGGIIETEFLPIMIFWQNKLLPQFLEKNSHDHF